MIKLFDESYGNASDAEEQKVWELLQSLEVHMNSKGMKTAIYYNRSEQVVPGSQQEKKFASLKDKTSGKLKFYAKEDQFETNDFYFFLAKVILDALIVNLPHLKALQSNDSESRDKSVFIHYMTELLKCKSTIRYKSIISDFKSFSFFNV